MLWTVVLEKTLESPSDSKEITPVNPKENQFWIFIPMNIHWKDWCWSWNSNILATWWEELTHWKRPWCWERLRARGEGGDRGWDGWMASPSSMDMNLNKLQEIGSLLKQGSLVCCSPWGCRESDMTWWLNKQQLFRTIFWTAWDSAKHRVYCTLESAAPSQLHTTTFFCPLVFHHNESNGT